MHFGALVLLFGIIATVIIEVCRETWGDVVTEVYIPKAMAIMVVGCLVGLVLGLFVEFCRMVMGRKP